MAVYPLYMALSIYTGRILSLQTGRLLGELVHVVTDLLSVGQGREEAVGFAAEELEDVRQSRRGDSDAYRRLIERHQERIGRIMWRFSRDRRVHEELVQDVFVEAYMGLGGYRGRAPFAHWLARIATHVGYSYWRQTARRQVEERFTLEEWDQLPGQSGEEIDPGRAAALVHSLLGRLPPRDRLVLTLRYLEECNVAETARRIGWTKSMVKVQSRRAKKKLEKLLSETEKELIR